MPSEKAREIALEIFDTARDLHDESDQTTPLSEKVTDKCTAYQQLITNLVTDTYGLEAGIVTDPDARVESLQESGHTIGFIKVNPDTDELVAFDATIAQNGKIHHRRQAKIWFGTAPELSEQLKQEFGGTWDSNQILGSINDFNEIDEKNWVSEY